MFIVANIKPSCIFAYTFIETNMKTIYCVIETKSNFNGQNGLRLKVKQFCGTIVNVSYIDETETERCFDVTLSEVKRIIEIND